ncbi:hypoxia-inducbile hig1 -related [Holotrichia oblita]|uniref:Hypoxia-inducbile hig1 -related n=1 Tax=Holotrichia oblita TaxID=644536 RepID=A0ACB9TT75_HOLOL|nr:hypoxia-inducbile hig1 -related [Holotrichia oblita]
MGDKPTFTYEQESQAEKLARKSKEMPIFPIAISGLVAAVAFGAYKFNKRGKMSPSVFLMQLRVGAQGVAVGALTVGLLVTMANQYLHKKEK